jgi:hypothetical protein
MAALAINLRKGSLSVAGNTCPFSSNITILREGNRGGELIAPL